MALDPEQIGPSSLPGSDDVDGRRARRDRNRSLVLDTVLALFTEGELTPTPAEVADRCGVSLRSVYRYFSDPEDLLRAAIARHAARVQHLLPIADEGSGALVDRIDRFVESRLRLYEAVAATARAGRVAGARNELIRAQYDTTRDLLRRQVAAHFGLELAGAEGPALTAAVDALTQLETLDHFRLHVGLTSEETGRHLRVALAALLS